VLLIPDPFHQLIIGTSVKLMDLGSVIIDCEDKHYNRVSA